MENYRPVSLLAICGKIDECLFDDTLFKFFSKNNLLSSNQSGFKPGDSCISKLISVAHEILNAFDSSWDIP